MVKTRVSKCLNLPLDQCVGDCEYIVTRRGKAKQYCRKKTARLLEHTLREQLARERARNVAERARAKKINSQRVRAEQRLTQERGQRAAHVALARQLVEQDADTRTAAERARAKKINRQRAKAEQQLARERGLNAELARARQLAEEGAQQELARERGQNAAELARARQVGEDERARARENLMATEQKLALERGRRAAERATQQWAVAQQALKQALHNAPNAPLPLVYKLGKNYKMLTPDQVDFVYSLRDKYVDKFGDAYYYRDGTQLSLALNSDPATDLPIYAAKLELQSRGAPGPLYYFTPAVPYTLMELDHRFPNSQIFSIHLSHP